MWVIEWFQLIEFHWFLIALFTFLFGALVLRSFTTTAVRPAVPLKSPSINANVDLSSLPCWTLAEIQEKDGRDEATPLWMGCSGLVFDVSSGRGFYGPGGPYSCFAGRDASRGLGRMEIKYESANIRDLTGHQKQTMEEWSSKYMEKYPIVGRIVDPTLPNSGWLIDEQIVSQKNKM